MMTIVEHPSVLLGLKLLICGTELVCSMAETGPDTAFLSIEHGLGGVLVRLGC